MADCLSCLGHYTVIGTDNEYYYVRNACTSGAHFGEGFMAGGIEEYYFFTVLLNDIRTYVLSDTSGFVFGNA